MKRQILTLPELYEKFKSLCKQKGFHMKEVLEKAGVPEYTGLWKQGKGRAPSYQELAIMANTLDVPAEVLIYKDRDPQVHIEKEKFDKLLTLIEEITGLQESEKFDYQK